MDLQFFVQHAWWRQVRCWQRLMLSYDALLCTCDGAREARFADARGPDECEDGHLGIWAPQPPHRQVLDDAALHLPTRREQNMATCDSNSRLQSRTTASCARVTLSRP